MTFMIDSDEDEYGDCYRDYTLFFEGCVVNPLVKVQHREGE